MSNDFLKLWAGQTISEIGSRISREGLPMTAVLLLGATPLDMGLLSAIGGVSVLLFSLGAGVIADRWRRRPIMIAADAVRAVLLATIPAAAFLDSLTMFHLLAVAAAVGVFTVGFDVAYQSYLPSLVPEGSLLEGNRRLAMSASAAEIVGPSLGGMLVQVATAPVAILLDAASFIASAVCVWAIRKPEPAPLRHNATSMRDEVLTGARLVRAHPVLSRLAMRDMCVFFSGGAMASMYVLYAIRVLRLTPAELGITIALGGAGSLIGAALTSRIAAHWRPERIFLVATAVASFLDLLIPLAAAYPRYGMLCLGIAQLVGDAAWSLYFVTAITYRQSVTAPAALGRVSAVMQLASRGVLPIGALGAGVLAQVAGIVPTLWIGCAGILASNFFLVGIGPPDTLET